MKVPYMGMPWSKTAEFMNMKNAILDLRDGFYPEAYHESDICNRCGQRKSTIIFTDGLRIIPLCPECMEKDYHLDFYFFKYVLLLSYVFKTRMAWRAKYASRT